jgi:glycine dehydrogenase
MSEREVLDHLRATAKKNTVMLSLIGQGYHGTIMPPVIQRTILENPAWYTAYTPYQPEISQGRLEALLNFQTMVATSPGSTSPTPRCSTRRRRRPKPWRWPSGHQIQATAFFVDHHCHPQTIDVIRTRAEPLGWEVIVGDPFTELDAQGVRRDLPVSRHLWPCA